MPARFAVRAQSPASKLFGSKVAAVNWYSSTGSGEHCGSAGLPPAIGHESSQPRCEECPQWMNIPKRAASNQSAGMAALIGAQLPDKFKRPGRLTGALLRSRFVAD